MNKSEFIDAVANSASMTRADTEKCIDAVIGAITAELVKGGRVTLTDFVTFSVVPREARTGRHPRTGKPIEIKAKRIPKFKAGKALKDAVSAVEASSF